MNTSCIRCKRPFETTLVSIPGIDFDFVADRFCDVCKEAEQAEADQLRADILFAQAHIPPMLRECSFSNFKPLEGTRHALSVVQKWSADFRQNRRPSRGLFLHGPTGGGKTHLGVSVLREAIYSRFTRCLLLNVPEWLDALRAAMNSFDEEEPPNPEGYEIVVIDDLGSERATEWTRERIYGLINQREQAGLLTIITSNYDVKEISRRLGPATASRLIRLCADVPMMNAVDFRAHEVNVSG